MQNINRGLVWTYAAVAAVTLIGLFLIKELDIAYPIELTTTTRSGELSVVGEGKVEVVPDTAFVDAGISVVNVSTVEQAETRINEANNQIVQAMTELGIQEEDIKTSDYSITPNYDYGLDNGDRRITGYNGNATITIKIRETDLASDVVSTATAAGANTVGSVRFDIDDPQVYRDRARDEAIGNAKEQAQKLSQQLGIRLGRVTNFVESSSDGRYPIAYAAGRGGVAEAEAPVLEPGSQTVTSTVTLFFETR